MTWGTPVTASGSHSGGAGTATTGAIDTTGKNIIVIGVVSFNAEPTPTDSQSNTWTKIVGVIDGTNSRNQSALWYSENPSTSATHTFSAAVNFGSIAVAANSGANVPSLDQSNGSSDAGNGSTTTCPAGSVTPGQGNEWLVSFFGMDDPADTSTPTINASFVQRQFVNSIVGSLFGCYLADLVQSTAAAVNPTITRPVATPSGRTVTGVVATFKGTAAAGQPDSLGNQIIRIQRPTWRW